MPTAPHTPNHPARLYIVILLALAFVGLLGVLTINLTADPFSVFGRQRRPGFNDRLPNVSGFDRMSKPYEILHYQPHTVLMGSSTAHSGFLDLGHWDVNLPKPMYNYALLGANAHEVRLSLEQAVRECQIETAVVIADFFAYNINYRDNERFKPARLNAASHHDWLGFTLEDLGAFALGIDSLRLGWQTLRDSRPTGHAPQNATSAPPAVAYWLVHFRNCEKSYLDKWLPAPAHAYEFADTTGHDRLSDLEEILRLCAEKKIRLIVIIPPIHSRFQESIAALGLWPKYEAFKHALFTRTETILHCPGLPPAIELWDFSLFNSHTSEPVPNDSKETMQWWYDSAHFTPAFGLEILNQVQKGPAASEGALGVRLAPGNIDFNAHLASIRKGLEDYRSSFPGIVSDVHAVFGLQTVPPLTP